MVRDVRSLLALTGLLMLASCAGTPDAEGPGTSTAAVSTAPTETLLQTRAQTLWQARVDEDWPGVFLFRTPERRDGVGVEEFSEWSSENEPFVVHAFTIERTAVQDEIGWVEVDCSTSLRRYANVAPRQGVRWEKWRWTDDDWYPIEPRDSDMYPEAPLLRDAAEEQHLRARVDASWAARSRSDWETLLALNDPTLSAEIPLEDFAAAMSRFEYISHDVRWVEVQANDRGRAQVAFLHKLNDPSLSMAEPQELIFIEAWVRVDGEWYLAVQAPQ